CHPPQGAPSPCCRACLRRCGFPSVLATSCDASSRLRRMHARCRPYIIPKRMDLALKDKVAIVTGSSRGLGLASARALAAEGCLVVMCARGESRLRAAAAEVAAAGGGDDRVLAVTADVSVAGDLQRLVDRTVERF